MREALRKFDDWWFGSHSAASLGILRILLGAMAFLALFLTLFLFDDFYTPHGYAPNRMVEGFLNWESRTVFRGLPFEFRLPFELPRMTLLFGEPSPGWSLAVYLGTMAAAAAFSIGIWTRAAGITLAVGLISIHTRNPLIIHAGDTLLRLCIVYLALSPCGAMYSLDAVRRAKKGLVPLKSNVVRVTSQRLIQFQVAIVYLFTAWWKFFGTYWMDGTATWYPAKMHEFIRFPAPEFFERQPFLALETYGTLATEIALGTLVFWRPARKWVLLAGVLMHAYIEYRFNIPMFALIIVSCYVAFYEGEEVEAWVAKVRKRWSKPKPLEPAPADVPWTA